MIVQVVEIDVAPHEVEMVLSATRFKVEESNKEPGIVRFAAFRAADCPTKITIQEVYLDRNAMSSHKNTAHYAAWRAVIDKTMAVNRVKRIVSDCDESESILA